MRLGKSVRPSYILGARDEGELASTIFLSGTLEAIREEGQEEPCCPRGGTSRRPDVQFASANRVGTVGRPGSESRQDWWPLENGLG